MKKQIELLKFLRDNPNWESKNNELFLKINSIDQIPLFTLTHLFGIVSNLHRKLFKDDDWIISQRNLINGIFYFDQDKDLYLVEEIYTGMMFTMLYDLLNFSKREDLMANLELSLLENFNED